MENRIPLFTFVLTVIGIAVLPLKSQTPVHKPAFEVESIKRNTAREGAATVGDQPGGRFVASQIALRRLVGFAYRDNYQFLGGPEWMDNDRWDIEAKAPEGSVPPRSGALDMTAPDTVALMVQSLLEERFKLKAHKETRELPVYELKVAKGGLKMKLSDDQTPPAAVLGGGAGGGTLPRGGIRLGRNDIQALAQPVPVLTKALSALYAGRPVVDKTGLTGLYDITLQWINPPRGTANTNDAGTPPAADLGPSLFSAIEEQLGLRLESAKAPLPVLVIDSVQRPTEN